MDIECEENVSETDSNCGEKLVEILHLIDSMDNDSTQDGSTFNLYILQSDWYPQFHLFSQSITVLKLSGVDINTDKPDSMLHVPNFKSSFLVTICDLVNLTWLSLTDFHSKFKYLPLRIGQLIRLQHLDLRRTYTRILPWTLRFCTQLRVLKLTLFDYETLPFYLIQLPFLCEIVRGHEQRVHVPYTYTGKPQITKINRAESPPRLKLKSLMNLSIETFIQTNCDIYPNQIPSTLLKQRFEEVLGHLWTSCSMCHKLIRVKSTPQYYLVLPQWHGYSHMVLNAAMCSEQCTTQFEDLVNSPKYQEEFGGPPPELPIRFFFLPRKKPFRWFHCCPNRFN